MTPMFFFPLSFSHWCVEMSAYISHELCGVDGRQDRVSLGYPGVLKTLDSVSTIIGMSRRKTIKQTQKNKNKKNKSKSKVGTETKERE